MYVIIICMLLYVCYNNTYYNLKVHFMMTSCHQQQLFYEMLVLEVDTDVKV